MRRVPLDASGRKAGAEESGKQLPLPLKAYWKRTLRLTVALLVVWFLVGYVLAIILAPVLNGVRFLGGPLGFWIAQNGAIYVFWLLVLIYAWSMNRLDREFDVYDDEG